MNLPFSREHLQLTFQAFTLPLKTVFDKMEQAYRSAAACYAFSCSGCRDNCCRSTFYHHTFLEYCYLHEGFCGLDPTRQAEVIASAQEVCRTAGGSKAGGRAVRPMCPLNIASRCLLYGHRPMICRLHGIPHEFRLPGKELIRGAGCRTFDERCGQKQYYPFDRTSFYVQMAELEQAFKQQAGIQSKLKLTVAEMICSFKKAR
jgi:hypothetical protein